MIQVTVSKLWTEKSNPRTELEEVFEKMHSSSAKIYISWWLPINHSYHPVRETLNKHLPLYGNWNRDPAPLMVFFAHQANSTQSSPSVRVSQKASVVRIRFWTQLGDVQQTLQSATLIWMFDKLDTHFQVLPTYQDKFRQFFRWLLRGSGICNQIRSLRKMMLISSWEGSSRRIVH